MPARLRMSPVDTAWLRMDRASHLMAIKGVLVLDRPIDLPRLREVLQDRLVARFPRFRQRACLDATGAWWEDDPQFTVARHLRRRRLGRGEPEAELQRLVSRLAAEPLPPAQPLWCVDVVPRYGNGSALVLRVHHCMADGLALVGVMLSLTDAQPEVTHSPAVAPLRALTTADDGPSPPQPPWLEDPWSGLLDPLTQEALDSLETAQLVRERYERISADPQAAAQFTRQGMVAAAEVLKLLVLPPDAETRFKGRTARAKQVAWSSPLRMVEVRAVARRLGCSTHDVLLGCATGALRRYLMHHGDGVEGVEIRVMVPVSLRRGLPRGQLGNRFGLVPLSLPLHEAHPVSRVRCIQLRMEEIKASMLPPLTLGLMGLAGLAPPAVQDAALALLARRATAVITQVPGPTARRWLAGARIDQFMFWVPQSGDIGLGISILSYAGSVQFGLITDQGLVPDPQAIAPLFRDEFENLLYGLLLGA